MTKTAKGKEPKAPLCRRGELERWLSPRYTPKKIRKLIECHVIVAERPTEGCRAWYRVTQVKLALGI